MIPLLFICLVGLIQRLVKELGRQRKSIFRPYAHIIDSTSAHCCSHMAVFRMSLCVSLPTCCLAENEDLVFHIQGPVLALLRREHTPMEVQPIWWFQTELFKGLLHRLSELVKKTLFNISLWCSVWTHPVLLSCSWSLKTFGIKNFELTVCM